MAKPRFTTFTLGAAVGAAGWAALPQDVQAARVFGVGELPEVTAQQLLVWDETSPATLLSNQTITGLGDGASLLAIDFRPSDHALYGLGSDSRLYSIDVETAAATAVGDPFLTPLQGDTFGFDFNPILDRARVVSNSGQNLVINPNTGAVETVGDAVAYSASDANASVTPSATANAYTNNFVGSPATALYAVDNATGNLVVQQGDAGTLDTVGSTGLTAGNVAALDVSGFDGIAYAVATSGDEPFGASRFYRVDFNTGAFTDLGAVGTGWLVTGMSAEIVPTPAAAALGLALLGGLAARRRPRWQA